MLATTLMDKFLLGAAFSQIVLTFGLMFWLGHLRIRAVRRHEVRLKDVTLATDKYPPQAQKISRAFDNQFQLPMLFYVGVLFILVLGHATVLDTVLAWIFVILRFGQAFVATTFNHITTRFTLFLFGLLALSVFLFVLFARLIFFGAS